MKPYTIFRMIKSGLCPKIFYTFKIEYLKIYLAEKKRIFNYVLFFDIEFSKQLLQNILNTEYFIQFKSKSE